MKLLRAWSLDKTVWYPELCPPPKKKICWWELTLLISWPYNTEIILNYVIKRTHRVYKRSKGGGESDATPGKGLSLPLLALKVGKGGQESGRQAASRSWMGREMESPFELPKRNAAQLFLDFNPGKPLSDLWLLETSILHCCCLRC